MNVNYIGDELVEAAAHRGEFDPFTGLSLSLSSGVVLLEPGIYVAAETAPQSAEALRCELKEEITACKVCILQLEREVVKQENEIAEIESRLRGIKNVQRLLA